MDVLAVLTAYAADDDDIRAVLLQGSRAFGVVDQYSDWDVVFVTVSNQPYLGGTIIASLENWFGTIAVMQTPDNGDPRDVYTHLVQFTDGTRIDLTFSSLDFLAEAPLESATVVVLDKDARFTEVPPASDADYWLSRPTAEQFRSHANQFWWCAPYVAKAVARHQLVHALELLSDPVRQEYEIMLAWLAGARADWHQVNVGKHLSSLEPYLSPSDARHLDALRASYAVARAPAIMAALEVLMTQYQVLAAVVADRLGYPYEAAEGERTMRLARSLMATVLKRTTISHIPSVQRSLALARREWPEATGSDRALMQHIIEAWAEQAAHRQAEQRRLRAERIRVGGGVTDGVYGPGYLDEEREGWRA